MNLNKDVWVAFSKNQSGFLTKSGSYLYDFSKARIFSGKGHLSNSVGKSKIDNGDIIPVKLTLSLDPEIRCILELS